MAITEFRPQDQNVAQAPTLGGQSGTFGADAQQRRNIAQGGSGRFTNLQQYVQANEANNPNAQLLQREAQTRQGELGTKQAEFTTQATPIKTGFETIRSGQQFVQSALQNPTEYTTPERLQQFAGYRTSGIGDIETPYNQLQTLRSGLGTQQEQLASGLETIQRNPNALQNYIQSQRANPALATRGENVLDRFLTQSTQSGQQAIAGLGTTASAIRQAQAPTIASEVEGLKTQAQGGPLSSADVRNLLTAQITPEEQYVRDINNLYVAKQSGIGQTEPEIQSAKSQYDNFDNLSKQIVSLKYSQAMLSQAPNDQDLYFARRRLQSQSGISPNQQEVYNEAIRDKQEKINNLKSQNAQLENQINSIDKKSVNNYINYIQNLNKTKQELLSEYDPTRLSKIQALQQLAGTTQFNPLLQTRLA